MKPILILIGIITAICLAFPKQVTEIVDSFILILAL